MTRGGVLHMMQSANAFMTPDGSMSHQAVIVCNAATGVRNGDALVCPETWLAPLKFKDGARHAAYDIGTGSGTERWRGDVTFVEFHAILTRHFHPILTHPYSSPAGSRCG